MRKQGRIIWHVVFQAFAWYFAQNKNKSYNLPIRIVEKNPNKFLLLTPFMLFSSSSIPIQSSILQLIVIGQVKWHANEVWDIEPKHCCYCRHRSDGQIISSQYFFPSYKLNFSWLLLSIKWPNPIHTSANRNELNMKIKMSHKLSFKCTF